MHALLKYILQAWPSHSPQPILVHAQKDHELAGALTERGESGEGYLGRAVVKIAIALFSRGFYPARILILQQLVLYSPTNILSASSSLPVYTWVEFLHQLQGEVTEFSVIKHLSEAISRTAGLWPAVTDRSLSSSQGTNGSVGELFHSSSSISFIQPLINQNQGLNTKCPKSYFLCQEKKNPHEEGEDIWPLTVTRDKRVYS